MFSPLSSHLALVMLILGAKGKTKTQLKSGLGFSTEDGVQSLRKKSLISKYRYALRKTVTKDQLKVEMANIAYLAKKPSNKFNKLIFALSGEKPSVIDFKKEPEVRGVINQFVQNRTHGKIKNLIKKGFIKGKAAFIIVNALYFKGKTSMVHF